MNPLGLTPRLCRAPDAAVCQGTIPSHLEATGNPREPWGSGEGLEVPLLGQPGALVGQYLDLRWPGRGRVGEACALVQVTHPTAP